MLQNTYVHFAPGAKYSWTGHKAPPHEWVDMVILRDQKTYQVFGSVDLCVMTNPNRCLPSYIEIYTCGHHICNVTDIFCNGNPLNTPKKCTFQHPVT